MSESLAGLTPGADYHVRLVARSSAGTTRGADVTFRTAGVPVVGRSAVSGVSLARARIDADVATSGLETSVWIEVFRRGAFVSRTGTLTLPAAGGAGRVSLRVAGLAPGTRYSFRVVARNVAGTATGSSASFGTAARPRDEHGRLLRCTIVGTNGPDRLVGTGRRDVICGLGGADVLVGRGGNDVLVGGPGNDYALPGTGRDVVLAGAGNDFVARARRAAGPDRRRVRRGSRRGSTGGSTRSSPRAAWRRARCPTEVGHGGEASRIPAVAVAADHLERLRTGGLAEHDPEIAALIGREADRQRGQIELIASENFTWPAVLEAVGSVLTNKYAEGYPGRRYYGGCEVVDEIEQLAIDRAKELFGAEHANVQPHAGAQANMAVYLGLLEPGDTVLSLRLDHGGHLTHGLKVNFSGRLYTIVHYGVSRETGVVDEDEVRALAREHRPKIVICGGSAYPRTVDTAMFRRIADEVGALLWCDMAHFAGLVAAGLHPNPVEHCDVVTSTTHKTLAGPRAGIVLCRAEHATAIDRAVFPGMQGGPLEHVIAAKATCFRIAATDGFRAYQQQVRTNADALAETLLAGGIDLLTGGTDTHLLQLDLRATEWSGKDAEERLDAVGLTTNRNTVPFDERPPTIASGVRVGTQAATMRGFDDDDFREVGSIVVEALTDGADLGALRGRTEALCAKRPLYPGFRGFPTYLADGEGG